MADSNPYGALNEEEDTYDTFQQGEQKDADFFHLKNLVTDVKVELPHAQVKQTEDHISLLACSSKYGYFVAATAKGFCLGQTEKLRKTIYQTVKGEAVPFNELIEVEVKQEKVHHISLSADQLELLVSVSAGTILTYSVHDIVQQKENASPSKTYSEGCGIISFQPNPEAYPDIIAIRTVKNQCKLIQNKSVLATMDDVHSICWSHKGKQIACGSSNGTITTYNLQGEKKVEIKPPAAFQGGEESCRVVESIIWLENKLFFAVYTPKAKDSDQLHSAYIIDDTKTTEDEKFVLMDEVLTLLAVNHPSHYFYSVVVRNVGPEAKTVIILANSAANELNVVGQDDAGRWATWIMDTAACLPLNNDETDDTYPVGIAVDYSASEPLPPFDKAENDTPVPPMPVLFVMTNEGLILSYHVYNVNLAMSGVKCEEMIEAQDINTIPSPQRPATTTSESKIPKAIPSAFGTSNSNPTVGSNGFGFTTDPSPINFASLAKSSSTEASKLPQPVSAFGGPTAFGQSSGFGQPAFGSSSFGYAAPAIGNAPSFGGFKNVVKTTTVPSSADSHKPYGESAFAPSRWGSDSVSADRPESSMDEQPLPSTKQPTTAFSQGSPSAFGSNLFGATSFTSASKLSTVEDEQTKEQAPVSDGTVQTSSAAVTGDSASVSEEKSSSNVRNEQELPAQTASEGDQHVPPTTLTDQEVKENVECSMSFEQVKLSLEDDDVDVRSGDSDFSKTDSNQEEKEACGNGFNSEDDYFDRDNQTSSEQGSVNEQDQSATEAKLKEKHEQTAEKERIENEKRLEEVARLEQVRAANEKRFADEQRLADERQIVKEKQAAEAKRLEDEARRLAQEAKRLEDEAKRLEDERIAEITKMEEERIAEEKRLEAERVAAIKPDLKFSTVVECEADIKPYERSKGLAPMAAEFENAYFSTREEMESTTSLLRHIENVLLDRNKNVFKPAHADAFNDFEYAWKVADTGAVSRIIDDLNIESKAAMYTEFDKPFEGVDITNKLETKENYLEAKRPEIDALFDKIDSKLAHLKEQSTKQMPTKYSKMKRFELEKIVRDIRRDINAYDDKVYRLASKELSLRRKNNDQTIM
ncbi:hypothetical protein [Parasitella parasitica]|uniref:Nucleoporin Nup159/Nup146 N-terminal domain-containing protein n=1 Tax=Parasitella parasitica TaxID=35722 RepID=A0A0B7NI78_9FUNG|nr:hypothetical protein [Parasitella parasitica]